MKFDEVLEEIGGFGRYQKWIFFLTCSANLFAGFFMLNPVFLLAVPLHRCAIPGYENDTYQVQNEYHQYFINMTIPRSDLDDETYDRCNLFEAPKNTERKGCNRWVYDTSVFEETFASQENLVCEDEIMVANAEMVFYGGMVVGSLVGGIIADKYGRKIVMYVSLLTMVTSAISLSFAHTYALFVILEFILGAAMVSMFVSGYVISVAFVYFGVSLNMSNLAGDMYLNFGLLGIVELPAYFIVIGLVDRIGRRRLYCSMMLIGGTACVSTFFVIEYGSEGVDAITLTLTLLGKLCVTAGFSVQYIHSAELFPTVVRNSGVGGASVFARLGTMVAPYIVNLGENLGGSIGKSLPLVVFGSISFLSGLLWLLLPETLHKNLPETLEDADRFGKSRAFFLVKSLRLHNSYRDTSVKVASIKEQYSECELLISTEHKRKR